MHNNIFAFSYILYCCVLLTLVGVSDERELRDADIQGMFQMKEDGTLSA